MKNPILLLFFILVYSQGFSQNTFFIGEKTYPCSKTYELGNRLPKLEVLFVKNGEQGMIAITTEAHLGSQRIKGKLMIYLDDSTIITCVDNNKYDIVNDDATTVYNFTKDEINRLKNTNILNIRYTVGCVQCRYDDFKKDYRVENKTTEGYFGRKRIDFPTVIRELFD